MLGPAAHARVLAAVRESLSNSSCRRSPISTGSCVGEAWPAIAGNRQDRHAVGERDLARGDARPEHGDEQQIRDAPGRDHGVGVRSVEDLPIRDVEEHVTGTCRTCTRRGTSRSGRSPSPPAPRSATSSSRIHPLRATRTIEGSAYHTIAGDGNAPRRAGAFH